MVTKTKPSAGAVRAAQDRLMVDLYGGAEAGRGDFGVIAEALRLAFSVNCQCSDCRAVTKRVNHGLCHYHRAIQYGIDEAELVEGKKSKTS